MDFIPILAMVGNAVHVIRYDVRLDALRTLGALVVLDVLGALVILGDKVGAECLHTPLHWKVSTSLIFYKVEAFCPHTPLHWR